MKYKTVVIDFPWPIKIGKSPDSLENSRFLNDELSYPTITLEELQLFPINDYAADECQLFIWVTTGKAEGVPILKFALELLEIWGFEYHQLITWGKTSGFCVFSPIRSVTEHILYGYRGKLANGYSHMTNLFITSQQKHSEKPARFYQMLREWTPEPRIDLFARRAHYGFDGWGDEYAGDHGPLLPFLKKEGET